MSRFHDEFFRQGSPAHDALMIKCTSNAGIKKITDMVDLAKYVLMGAKDQTRWYRNVISICESEGNKHAWKGDFRIDRENEKLPHIYSEYPKKESGFHDYSKEPMHLCSLVDKCKHAPKCKFYSEGKEPYTKNAELSLCISDLITTTKYETEVIVRNGNFILGYADAVIRTTSKVRIDAIIEEDWTWKDFGSIETETDILIEAKPKISSIGEVIRQLKTYRDSLCRARDYHIPLVPIIVTYTNLEANALDYLRNEGIHVVVFEDCI